MYVCGKYAVDLYSSGNKSKRDPHHLFLTLDTPQNSGKNMHIFLADSMHPVAITSPATEMCSSPG